jgi:hypothetical protein
MSALRASVWAPAIGIATIVVLAMAMLDSEASAHDMGRRVHSGGGRGVSFGHGGPGFSHSIGRSSAVHSFSSPRSGHATIGSHSFSGNRFVGHTTTTGSLSRAASISHAANVATDSASHRPVNTGARFSTNARAASL